MSPAIRAAGLRPRVRMLSALLLAVGLLGGGAGTAFGNPLRVAGELSAPMVRIAWLRTLLFGELQDICAEGETTIYFEAGRVEPEPDEAVRAQRVGDCLSGLPIGRPAPTRCIVGLDSRRPRCYLPSP